MARIDCNDEFEVFTQKAIDIGFAVETAVHDQLDLVKAKNLEIVEKIFDGADIWDISGQFTIVKG